MNKLKNIIQKYLDILQINDEFEILFNKNNVLNQKNYIDLLKYIKNKKFKILETLDVIYSDEINYRINIEGLSNINDFITNNLNKTNTTIFQRLLENKEMKKEKKIVKVNEMFKDFDYKIKISEEKELIKEDYDNIKRNQKINNKILYRFKNRVEYVIFENENYYIRVDLTKVKQTIKLDKLNSEIGQYELELEVKKSNEVKIDIDNIITEFNTLKNIINNTTILINYDENEEILLKYRNLLDKYTIKNSAYGMQPVSLLPIHYVSNIKTEYTITDKVDGERYFLLIFDENLYLMNNNLIIQRLNKQIKNLTNCILDGEYVFRKNKHLYLAFDILFYNGENIMSKSLLERFEYLNKVMKKLNVDLSYLIEPTKLVTLEEINNFHKKNIEKYHELLIENYNKNDITIMRKYFIFPIGINNMELYRNSILFWNTTTNNSKLPISLDGLMFTHIRQEYTRNLKDIKYPIYKWKPSEKLTIDFYIEFKKDNNGKILNIYDNSEKNKNLIYRICNLYVNSSEDKPVLFKQNENLDSCYLYLDNNYVRDKENNIVEDKSVVEFLYINDIKLDVKQRWKVLKVRYDKTETVKKYNIKYGNNEHIADDVFNSIINKIELDDFIKLSNEKTYYHHIDFLNSKIGKIEIAKQTKAYYEQHTSIMKEMDQFHNYVKSNIIFYFCSPKQYLVNETVFEKKMEVLDLGVGRGGDFIKFFHAKVKLLVGIDIDEDSIFNIKDSAISRYENNKKKYPSFPQMDFIISNIGYLLNYNAQLASMGNVINRTKDKILKYFGENETSKYKKFDILNCQFVIHYLLKNELTWNNFKQNIKKHINKYGFLLITTFDGESVLKLLENTNKIDVNYNDINGNKVKLYSIIRKFDILDKKNLNWMKLGLVIDVNIGSFMESDTYRTEYLVNKNFLISELKQLDFKLIDTGMFDNFYTDNKDYITNYSSMDINSETGSFISNKVGSFYKDNEINKLNMNFSKLNRFFIFQNI